MSDIIGIIPGAGRASRIGGFFKELTPIKLLNKHNNSKIKREKPKLAGGYFNELHQ